MSGITTGRGESQDNGRERKMPGSNDKNRNLTLRRKKMKLSILLAGSILTSAIAGNAYAQTCGAQPSCSSLGYTYTGSTSDCVNTPMKCPFNTSYFNCVKKADVIKNMVLDWSKKKSINPTSSTYYPTSYGIVIGRKYDSSINGMWWK